MSQIGKFDVGMSVSVGKVGVGVIYLGSPIRVRGAYSPNNIILTISTRSKISTEPS